MADGITDNKDKQRDPDPILVLNDQGGSAMNVSDKPGALRAQMKHHEPIVCFQLCGDRDNPGISVSDTAYCLPANPMSDRSQAVCYPINTMVATRGGRDDMRTTFGIGDDGDPQFTISAAHSHAVCYGVDCRNGVLDEEKTHTIQAKASGGQSLNCTPSVLWERGAGNQ